MQLVVQVSSSVLVSVFTTKRKVRSNCEDVAAFFSQTVREMGRNRLPRAIKFQNNISPRDIHVSAILYILLMRIFLETKS